MLVIWVWVELDDALFAKNGVFDIDAVDVVEVVVVFVDVVDVVIKDWGVGWKRDFIQSYKK